MKHSLSQYLQLDVWNWSVFRVTLSGSGEGSVPCLSHSFWDCQPHLALFLADTSLQSLSTSSHMSSTVCVFLGSFYSSEDISHIGLWAHPTQFVLLLTKALFLNKISSWSSKKQMKEGGTSNLVHSPYSCLRVQMRQQLVAPEQGSRWDQGHSFMARYQSNPITSLALHSVKQDWWEHISQEVGIIKAILEAGYMLHLKKYTQPHQTLPRCSPHINVWAREARSPFVYLKSFLWPNCFL